jgi:outer membrane protein
VGPSSRNRCPLHRGFAPAAIPGFLCALFLATAAVSSAQDPAPTPVVLAPAGSAAFVPVRVATIFGQNAIVSTQEGQKASAALNAKYAPKKDEFTRKQAELQTLREQLKKNLATMNTEARDRLNQAIDAKNKELQRIGEDSQNALEQEMGVMLQELGDKLLEIVRQYASRNGYTVVFDVSMPDGPVLWASPSVDITNEIVKLYDQAHPVAPVPATPPPAKK